MNLRQQFFWKVLLGLSTIIILFSLFRSYSKYSEYRTYRKEYEKEAEVKGNEMMERKTNFISENQSKRIELYPNFRAMEDKVITNHKNAGITTNAKTDYSNDPIYKGMTNGRAMIDYRDSKGDFYKIGQKISGTDMEIYFIDKDSVIIKYPTEKRTFYTESYKDLQIQ